MDSKGRSGMDSTSKGRSLPSMPEALNPVSMKQPSEPLGGRKGRGGGDLGADPALLMDKAAAQLAVTLQDSVLNNMASHGHSHERLKDLTSLMLNGDQDKLPKLCPPEPPTLKGAEAPSSHPSPQRKATSPEIKLKITKMVSKGTPARFETFCGEGPNLPTEGLLVPASRAGRKRRLIKPKPLHKLASASNHDPVPVEVSAASQPEEGTAAPQQIQQASPLVEQSQEEELPVHTVFSVGDVVWTKVSGYPWWPCMVSTDPELNTHLKHKAINSHTSGILYHVQYFGNTPERGYIFEKNMASFSREEQYVELCHGNKQPSSRVVHRKSTTSSVPRKLHAQWVVGITQAKEAASLALEERLAKYTFTYDTDGPHLNPRLLAEPGPAEPSPDLGPEQTKAQTPDQEPPSPTSPQVQPTPTDCSTSLEEKKSDGPRTTDGTEKQRKQTTSTLKKETTKKTEVLVSHKGQTEMPSQDLVSPSSETGQLDPHKQKQKKSKLKPQLTAKTERKRSKGVALTTNMLETLPHAPIAKKGTKTCPVTEQLKAEHKGKKDPQKKQLPGKRALQIDEDQQPKKKRGVGDKQKAVAADSSAPTKKRNRKITETEVKGFISSKSPEKEPEKTKPIMKRRLDSASQLAASQTKKRKQAASSPEPEGSGIEERPESPSDSIDQTNGAKKTNGGGPKKESVCQVCEQAGEDVVPCEGQCCGSFHLSCLGSTFQPQDRLLCPDCTSGVHQCFSCKLSEGEVHRCNVQHCGKFYHEACVRPNALTVFDNKGFRCPLHNCLSCHSKPKATKGKLMRCLRCPVAYHTGEVCVAAGSEMLTPTTIICTNHFSPKKGYSHHSHVNVSWCFVCSKGGQLLCCESCPAAFHPDCLNIAMPDGSWFCNDCRAGKKPKYRDIIWVKLGNYRWWPAEIQHPRNIPTNIQHLRHEIGEFPVFFFGSKDYFWTHQGRVFPYMEGDRGSRFQKTGIGKVFKNALLEAETRFKEIKMEREAKEAQENNRKPPPYKYIKINKPCGRVQVYTADVSEIPKCNCKPTDEKPCGFESECLNRMLMYECHPQVCPNAERCCNQDFTKRHYPETKIIKTAGKGWGLVALRDIKKGEFVNEYIGELIDEEECRSRIKYYQENDITHFYMLTIDKDRIIDAGPKGNYSRFMNHSCQPNCETQKWTVNGDTRVGLFAVCDIPAGTELTFNYNLDCLGNEKTVCRCGAPNCSGFLGDRPKTSGFQAAEPKGKKAKKKVKKRRTRNEGKESEDECFRCGDGGQLVLCDRKSCTKAFHLSCLDRTKRPFGKTLTPDPSTSPAWTAPRDPSGAGIARGTTVTCVGSHLRCSASCAPTHSARTTRRGRCGPGPTPDNSAARSTMTPDLERTEA
ncbi:histone-lysine N-methyltransferase NSD2-like isoform X2 [Salvelinus alpinus]|uniref:histone-lysine N-methyltransferase NSD2-like isoform X2 n=1 Tax=Salvelinus alpinus TaxID=8036 RepID=UPI0039FC9F47